MIATPTPAPLVSAKSITMRFGGFHALDGVDLDVLEAERLGLIGPNGSGKSTLTAIISGALFATEGTVTFAGQPISTMALHRRAHIGIARTFQIPRPFHSMTVEENVQIAVMYGRRDPSSATVDESVYLVLHDVGLGARAQVPASALTQVELRKLELARAMAMRPRLLIADEAMAGLSHSEVEEILELLLSMKARGIAVLMIEHIMQAVTAFSERIVVLIAGKKVADGSPQEVLSMPQVVSAYLGEGA
ncbi:Branched-chain amino acid transport system ATP-binding protein OS=Castellaniella defragrans OX=75697 GN=HNR28_003053 PE=4 SV=1 [Castellaniella defragrans]